jgi:hypothetical protein
MTTRATQGKASKIFATMRVIRAHSSVIIIPVLNQYIAKKAPREWLVKTAIKSKEDRTIIMK